MAMIPLAEVFAPVDSTTGVVIYFGTLGAVTLAALGIRAITRRAKRKDPTREVGGRDFLLANLDVEATAAELSPAEWAAEAAKIQARLDEWRADDEESIDLHAILDDAAWLYMVEVYVADIWMELLQRPMSAPTLHDAAMISLTAQAVDEGHVGFTDGQVDERNLVWLRDECWCWGTPNSACPRHVTEPARRRREDMWRDDEPMTDAEVCGMWANVLDGVPLPEPTVRYVITRPAIGWQDHEGTKGEWIRLECEFGLRDDNPGPDAQPVVDVIAWNGSVMGRIVRGDDQAALRDAEIAEVGPIEPEVTDPEGDRAARYERARQRLTELYARDGDAPQVWADCQGNPPVDTDGRIAEWCEVLREIGETGPELNWQEIQEQIAAEHAAEDARMRDPRFQHDVLGMWPKPTGDPNAEVEPDPRRANLARVADVHAAHLGIRVDHEPGHVDEIPTSPWDTARPGMGQIIPTPRKPINGSKP